MNGRNAAVATRLDAQLSQAEIVENSAMSTSACRGRAGLGREANQIKTRLIGGKTAHAYATTIISVNYMASVNRTHRPLPQALSAREGEAPPRVMANNATTRVSITAMIQESGTQRSVQRVSS